MSEDQWFRRVATNVVSWTAEVVVQAKAPLYKLNLFSPFYKAFHVPDGISESDFKVHLRGLRQVGEVLSVVPKLSSRTRKS